MLTAPMVVAIVGVVTVMLGIVSLVSVAVWRFTKVESILKILLHKNGHQHTCQISLVKAVSRLNARQKTMQCAFDRHITDEEKQFSEIRNLLVGEET